MCQATLQSAVLLPLMKESAAQGYWLKRAVDVVVGLAVSKHYTQKYADTFAGTSVVEA